ncbi:MAG: type II CAAX endopeptidase family protein [Flavobacterium sp.]
MPVFQIRKANKPELIGVLSILFILFFCSFFGASILLQLQGIDKVNATTLFLSRFIFWICVVLVWIYAIKIERQPLLVWEEHRYPFLTYLGHIFLVIIAIFIVLIPVRLAIYFSGLEQVSTKLIEMKSMLKGSKSFVLFVVFTAGITEEILFRGYIQPRLDALLKSPVLGILINSLLFALLHHGYGTLVNIIGPLFIGLIFSVYYWKFRNIKVLITCHILIDLIALSALLRS